MSVTGLTIRHTGECFQCLNDTFSKCFQKMLGIFLSAPFYMTYITLPNANTPPSQMILCNQKLWPFFQHALGAIDGTHIVCTPPAKECGMYWNRNKFLSQNCLFTCSFDLTFFFGYTGGISNRQPGVGGCTGLWIQHIRWALLSSRCRVSGRPPATASLLWC